MESESGNPLANWEQRSRRSVESQSVILPCPPPPVWRGQFLTNSEWPLQRHEVPPGAVHVRSRCARIGLDLICKDCVQRIPKSDACSMLCHFYAPDGPRGSPLTRCFFRCPYCNYKLVLGRNIGDEDNFVVIAGATQPFSAADAVPDFEPNLQNEAYPDAVLDSPNDFGPGPGVVIRFKSSYSKGSKHEKLQAKEER